MTETDTSTRPDEALDRRGWFARCMAPNTSPRDLRNSRRFGALMIVWALSSIVPGALGVRDGEPTTVALVAAAVSFVLFLAAVAAMVRFVRETDELNRLIQMRSIAVAFAAGIVTVVGAGLLVDVGLVEGVELDVVATVMIVTAGLSQLAWTASYHR